MKFSLRLTALSVGVSLGVLSAISSMSAQGPGELRVYKGEPIQQVGLSLLPWGSGDARESEEKVYLGSKSIKLTTHGRYQGARLVLQNPLDLKTVMNDNSAYLQLTIALANRDSTGSMGLGGDYGMMSGPGSAAMRGMMRGGRGGGPGAPGAPDGGGADGNSSMVKQKPIGKLRLVLVATDGKKMETWLPMESAVTVREEWKQLAVPVVAINGLKESAGTIKEVQLFGDTPAVVFIGELRVIRDETPIRVDDLPERTVAVNDPVQFNGSAEGGITPLVYEWDFDNQDGVALDKTGKNIIHRFRKSKRDADRNSQPFIVTLTVRDLYGIKKPATRTTKILVTI